MSNAFVFSKWTRIVIVRNFAYDFQEINKSVISWFLSGFYQQLWRKLEKKVFAALLIAQIVLSLKWTRVTISAMVGSGEKIYQLTKKKFNLFYFIYFFIIFFSLSIYFFIYFLKGEKIVKMCTWVRTYHESTDWNYKWTSRTDERTKKNYIS